MLQLIIVSCLENNIRGSMCTIYPDSWKFSKLTNVGFFPICLECNHLPGYTERRKRKREVKRVVADLLRGDGRAVANKEP